VREAKTNFDFQRDFAKTKAEIGAGTNHKKFELKTKKGKFMKTGIQTLTATVALLSLAAVAQAQFTPDDLVVLRDGTGSGALTSAGTAIFLDEYTTAANGYVTSVLIPSTGSSALVNSGTATSEGALNLSANGQYLVVAGYNANAGTASIASTTSAAVPRGIATVDASGNYNLAVTTSSFYSGNNIRSGASDGGGNYWGAGAASGTVYLGTGTPATVQSTKVNTRVIQDISGNLYFSTSSGSGTPASLGIDMINGTPTSSSSAVNLINTGSSSSPYDFAFNSSLTTAYIADSDAYTSSSGIGGVEKWSLVGSTWTFQYSLSMGTNGAVGLAVNFSGANPIIYATSANGASLFTVTDTGSSATGTLLDTAGANEAFRGLDFAPTPEPSACALIGLGLAGLWSFQRRNRKS
jgi:hypothetical protein